MNTGERIRYYRKQRNLTQAQLAELSSVSLSSIRAYEINARNPSFNSATKIASALGINVADIITNELYEKDKEDEKLSFITDYENGDEQLLFFDSLKQLRKLIDNIESDQERYNLALKLNQIFLSIGAYQKHLEEEENLYSVENLWKEKQIFINNFIRTTQDYIENYEDYLTLIDHSQKS